MKVDVYYRKYRPEGGNYEMTPEQAARLTLNDLVNDWALVHQGDWPEDVHPDQVFAHFQDRPLPLPAGVDHTSMSVGDLICIGMRVHVCLPEGWYTTDLQNLRYVSIITGKEIPGK